MTIQRISTNIPGVDEMIGGGFEENSTNLVTGSCGTGKSTFGLQFIYEGAKIGEKGLYVTIDEPIDSVVTTMSVHNWHLEDLPKKDDIHIMRVKPGDLLGLVKNEFSQITKKIKEIHAKRVVIDSISSIGDVMADDVDWHGIVLKLYLWLRKQHCTSLLIMNRPESIGLLPRHDLAESMVDGVIELSTIQDGSSRKNTFEVTKMRHTNHSRNIVFFKFKNGIFVYPKSKVF